MLSINDMKKVLLRAINIDNYMTFQNGSLIDIFDNNEDVMLNNILVQKYIKVSN